MLIHLFVCPAVYLSTNPILINWSSPLPVHPPCTLLSPGSPTAMFFCLRHIIVYLPTFMTGTHRQDIARAADTGPDSGVDLTSSLVKSMSWGWAPDTSACFNQKNDSRSRYLCKYHVLVWPTHTKTMKRFLYPILAVRWMRPLFLNCSHTLCRTEFWHSSAVA